MRGRKFLRVDWKALLACLLLLTASGSHAAKRDQEKEALAKYLTRLGSTQPAASALSPGSIWVDSGPMAALSADYKARVVGDPIEIVVSQGLTSSNANAVASARTLNTNSGITSLGGASFTSLANLLGLNSSETLAGKSSGSTATSVTTNLSGQVVAVLPGGSLVVEAERVIDMNNEKQTIVLRGVVRRGDIGPNNHVPSDSISDLELEIKGKGVVSDGVRPPHRALRALLRLFDF